MSQLWAKLSQLHKSCVKPLPLSLLTLPVILCIEQESTGTCDESWWHMTPLLRSYRNKCPTLVPTAMYFSFTSIHVQENSCPELNTDDPIVLGIAEYKCLRESYSLSISVDLSLIVSALSDIESNKVIFSIVTGRYTKHSQKSWCMKKALRDTNTVRWL